MAVKWPFTPEILDAMPEELADLFRELELKLLKEISDRLIISDQLNEVTVQDIRALKSHGIELKEIEQAIQEATGISEQKLNKLLDDVVKRNQRYYNQLINLADVTQPETIVDLDAIETVRRQTWSAFKNITGSMGFLVSSAGRLEFLTPAKAYEHCLDAATLQIQSGAVSYSQAIASATRELADSGVKMVYYEPAGPGKKAHYNQVDVAVRRAVMTGINQINDKYTERSAEYLGAKYYEVSAHVGARNIPKPNPWSSHESWQGGIYYESTNGEPDPLGKYKDLVTVTGFGEVDGLCGANCRHSRHVFLPGIMEPTYSRSQLDSMKAEKFIVDFEGKKYDRYEATQFQRKIETAIRRWKRRFAGATNGADAQAAKARIRRLTEKYNEFTKAAGLRSQIQRANVYQRK